MLCITSSNAYEWNGIILATDQNYKLFVGTKYFNLNFTSEQKKTVQLGNNTIASKSLPYTNFGFESLTVDSFDFHSQHSNKAFLASPKQAYQEEFSSILFLVTICDNKMQATVENFKDFWYGNGITSGIGAKMLECSNSNIIFAPKDNIIVPLNIPCQVMVAGKTIDYTRLTDNNAEDYAEYWMEYAVIVAENNSIDVSKYLHKVMQLPYVSFLRWAGLAYSECATNAFARWRCFTWINGPQQYSTYVHEFGHTFGIDHANKGEDEYADPTCAMGNIGLKTCFNAPHMYMLGWNTPIAKYTPSTLPKNKRLMFNLPLMGTSNTTFILYDNNLYISYDIINFVPVISIYTTFGRASTIIGGLTTSDPRIVYTCKLKLVYVDMTEMIQFVTMLQKCLSTHLPMILMCHQVRLK